ncbi:hypothetical protein G7L40_19900 [Paenibacillus polymyxa]|nr:hypothetical protein [Paenibacillus polymyxa]MBE7896246.1 hypothetical protein [Paenibacillus polymyxa]MCC3256774.1 competence protein CoiA [Paenibacillus polymyxa]QPK54738.1 hypothetical protein G7035_19945 [Paenibacillus polymyxa]QPK59829.1 hypothetical protein G7L40_19900 [Paenibacillus polymyxa]WEK65676.1 hypothetical protein ERJ71_15300 [Paenibacillus polymyxa]
MMYDNIKLWFARNQTGNTICIDEINNGNLNEKYYCPICGSELKPKATHSEKVSAHFAHFDISKCNSESMVHWWFKHEFIKPGDTFYIVTDKETKYVCEEIFTEETHKVDSRKYRPDVTIKTECGNTIFFEIYCTNKKSIRDYFDLWTSLSSIVVEIDTKNLLQRDMKFKALFYSGKCFNVKRNDTYYHTIGSYKEELMLSQNNNTHLKERVRKLDWFWDDVIKYKNNKIDIEQIANTIDSIENTDKHIVMKVLKKSMCANLYQDYKNFMSLNESAIFTERLGGSHSLNHLTNRIQLILEPLIENIEVKLISKNHYSHRSYYNGSRKHPYKYRKEFSHYTYCLIIRRTNKTLRKIEITNKILNMAEAQLKIFCEDIRASLKDRKVKHVCINCKKGYLLSYSEMQSYLRKELNIPKRCKTCRLKRRKTIVD